MQRRSTGILWGCASHESSSQESLSALEHGICKSDKLVVIKKESNFRSEEIIVNVLNKIRPELPQISASDDHDGRVIVITTNDYRGERQTKYYKGELPNEVLFPYVDNVRHKLADLGWTVSVRH